jgi:hypothetical protein
VNGWNSRILAVVRITQGMRRVAIDARMTNVPDGSRGATQRTVALAGHAEESRRLGY